MRMCEVLIAAATALIVSGNESYGITAFFLSMAGLLVRTSFEITDRQKEQEKKVNESVKDLKDILMSAVKESASRHAPINPTKILN